MPEFFLQHGSTLAVAAVLLLIVALIVRKLIKDRKKGGCSCSCGGCDAACPRSGK